MKKKAAISDVSKTLLETISGLGTGAKAGKSAYEGIQDILKTRVGQAASTQKTITPKGGYEKIIPGIAPDKLKATIMATVAGLGLATPVLDTILKQRLAKQLAAQSQRTGRIMMGALAGGGIIGGGALVMNALSRPSIEKTSDVKDIIKAIRKNKGKAAIGAAGILGAAALMHHAKRKLNKEMYGGQLTPSGWRDLSKTSELNDIAEQAFQDELQKMIGVKI